MSIQINTITKTSTSHATCKINSLPEELILTILHLLDTKDTVQASLTCRKLHQISNNSLLWKLHFFKKYPDRVLYANKELSYKELYNRAAMVRSHLVKGIYRDALLDSHTRKITCIKGGEKNLFTASRDGHIKIWRRSPSEMFSLSQELENCDDGIFELSEDLKYLIYKTNDTLHILSRDSTEEIFKPLQMISTDGHKISKCTIDKNQIFITSENGIFSVWKQGDNKEFKLLSSLPNVSQFYITNNKLILSFSNGTTIIQNKNDMQDHTPIHFEIPLENISLAICKDDCLIMTNSVNQINIFEKETSGNFQEVEVIEMDTDDLFDPFTTILIKDDYIFIGTFRGSIAIFKKSHSAQYNAIQRLNEHKERINAMALRDGYLFIGSTDSFASIWEKQSEGTFKKIRTLNAIDDGVTYVHIENDQFFTGYGNGAIKAWDFANVS